MGPLSDELLGTVQAGASEVHLEIAPFLTDFGSEQVLAYFGRVFETSLGCFFRNPDVTVLQIGSVASARESAHCLLNWVQIELAVRFEKL